MSRKLSSLASLACVFEIFIFLCFRFADWRQNLNSDIQLRIFWGAFAIVLFFIVLNIIIFFTVKKYYTQKDKTSELLKISLFGILGLSSSIIGYFL